MRSVASIALAIALTAGPAGLNAQTTRPGDPDVPANWDGQLLTPVAPDPTCAFAQPPTVRKTGRDSYQVRFAVTANCDVAVCVEDADGRIVRHLAYGVLGANAPAPFKKNSLTQTLDWDGKDEFGQYARDAAGCRFRVSLGLNPTFDKVIGYHPKDTSNHRNLMGLAADADGVYVLDCSGFDQLRQFDHDGRYVKTLFPWDPAKLAKLDMAKRTLPDARQWTKAAPPPEATAVPVLAGFGTTVPFWNVQDAHCMAAASAGGVGKLALFTKGGIHDMRRLMRVHTDGTSGGEPLDGPFFGPGGATRYFQGAGMATSTTSFGGPAHIAISPDGKWVYVTGLKLNGKGTEPPPFRWNAVYRFAWDSTETVVASDSFLGEVSRDPKAAGAGKDNAHFNDPQGLATDAAGNLYVADRGNDRIQVFAPDGKPLKTIPFKRPLEIAVSPKTGEIYVATHDNRSRNGQWAGTVTLTKLGPLANPAEKLVKEFRLVEGDSRALAFEPVMCLDAWAAEPRVWLVHEKGVVRVYADKGDRFELIDDFRKDVADAGHTPAFMTGTGMGHITVDRVRGHVYRGSAHCKPFARIDPADGKKWTAFDLSAMPGGRLAGLEEMVVPWNGMLYVRHLNYVARFDPDKMGGRVVLGPQTEVPFDYGQARGDEPHQLAGVIDIVWALGGANGFNNGLAVGPRGDVLAVVENYQSMDVIKQTRGGTWLDVLWRLMPDDRYRPRLYPGRVYSAGQLIWRWSSRGEITGEDLVPGLELRSCGVRTDPAGNLYVGVGWHQDVGGRPHPGGAVAKFPPDGGKIICSSGGPAKLEKNPDWPPTYLGGTAGTKLWTQNLFWSEPGYDELFFVDEVGVRYPCHCAVARFDTDLYGRTFMPKAYAYTVEVLDTNGNRICSIGRYGNADSPAMKPGDADIGLGHCSFVATQSDRWLYVHDEANLRIVRVKLGYRAQQYAPLAGAAR